VTGNFYRAGLRASSDSSGEIRYLASFRSLALALLYPDFNQKGAIKKRKERKYA